MFKKVSRLVLLVMVLALGVTGVAAADSGAKIYVIHGIPGAAGFPVDVSVNGACALPNFTFGQRVGPLSLPAGDYTIAVHAPADGACGGAAAIGPVTLSFANGDNKTIIAHLSAAGAPTASVFMNDFSATGRGSARILAHHTAAAPEVDVVLARNYNGGGPRINVPGFSNGEQIKAEVRPGDQQVTLELGGAPVFGPTTLNLKPFTATYVYAVGTFPSTFQYLVYTEAGLK